MDCLARPQTAEELSNILSQDSRRLYILKFGAEWCAPCKDSAAYFCSLASELAANGTNVLFVVIDRDLLEEEFQAYDITTMPTVIAIVNNDIKAVVQRPTPFELREMVKSQLPTPRLVLDADF